MHSPLSGDYMVLLIAVFVLIILHSADYLVAVLVSTMNPSRTASNSASLALCGSCCVGISRGGDCGVVYLRSVCLWGFCLELMLG